MKSSPEYNNLQYGIACAMKWYKYVYNSIELNIQRMIIYKNIGLDNIRKKKEKRINTVGDVCWFFRSLDNSHSIDIYI